MLGRALNAPQAPRPNLQPAFSPRRPRPLCASPRPRPLTPWRVLPGAAGLLIGIGQRYCPSPCATQSNGASRTHVVRKSVPLGAIPRAMVSTGSIHGPPFRFTASIGSTGIHPTRMNSSLGLASPIRSTPHSITSGTCTSSPSGTARWIARAARRFSTKSNLGGSSSGRSPGLAPFRIFDT